MYDWANSAFATVILSAVLPVYFVALVPEGGAVIGFFGFRPDLAGHGPVGVCGVLLHADCGNNFPLSWQYC